MGKLILLEVFDTFDNPLPFDLVQFREDRWASDPPSYRVRIEYQFYHHGSEYDYDVIADYYDDGDLTVEFGSNYDYAQTDIGSPFTIISTVVHIIKDMVTRLEDKGHSVKRINYETTTKRQRIFSLIVKKKFPNAKIKTIPSREGHVYVGIIL